MADARKDKRTLLSLKIRYKSNTLEDFIERYSNDISSGGVFIKAKKPLAVGTLLKFEFMLQDQSRLIHGVGRVVWRRDDAEADEQNPAGMGIKFIKMNPESRAVVKRIAEERDHPGVFEQGKEGTRVAPALVSDPGEFEEDDRTKVRHVSEFLASALEEGGAAEASKREAQAGAERARQISNQIGDKRAAARGAFSAPQDTPSSKERPVSDDSSRGAMSAFGGSGLSTSARMTSSAAPAMEELDAEDDFLDDQATRIQDYVESEYPHQAATVISTTSALPFLEEKRVTPVVPAPSDSGAPQGERVSDLFGESVAESFGPAPGESIDTSLLDPAVVTVPPQGASVPEAPGVPAEAFKLPQSPEPVWTTRPTPKKNGSRAWIAVLLVVLLLAGGAVAGWQLGYLDGLLEPSTANRGRSSEGLRKAPQVAQPIAAPMVKPEEASPEAKPADEVTAADDADVAAEATSVETAEAAMVKFQVTSRPSGAYVSVNGKRAGRTPLELEYEPGTKLSIFSKARGFLASRKRVTVEAGQAPLHLVLAPLPYVVQVITNPAGATASAVGGGQVTTPGELQFKSIPGSRNIVISKSGYKTASTSVTRGDFIEEPSRMKAAVNVMLQPSGAAAPTQALPGAETETPSPSDAEREPTAAPDASEGAPVPSETTVDDGL